MSSSSEPGRVGMGMCWEDRTSSLSESESLSDSEDSAFFAALLLVGSSADLRLSPTDLLFAEVMVIGETRQRELHGDSRAVS